MGSMAHHKNQHRMDPSWDMRFYQGSHAHPTAITKGPPHWQRRILLAKCLGSKLKQMGVSENVVYP